MPCCVKTSAAEYAIGPFTIPSRFFALLSFCVMAITNGFAWFEFDPVVTPARERFKGHVSDTTIHLLSSWQPIMFLVLFVPITIIVTKQDGLRRAMRIGASCAMVGGIAKITSCILLKDTFAGVLGLHAGQILVAVGAPSVIGGVSALAGTFFPPHERARATAVAILCNDLGGAVGYILSPSLASSSLGLTAVVLLEVVLVSVLCFLMWFVFPDAPKRRAVLEAAPDDVRGAEHIHADEDGDLAAAAAGRDVISKPGFASSHATFGAQLCQVVSKPTPVIVMLIFSWCSGGFVAWTSMFELMLEDEYRSTLIGTMAFVTSLGYVGGGLIAGYLIDKHFRKSMGAFITCALGVACVGTTAFTAVVPSFPETHPIVGIESPFLVFVCGGISGIGYGAATPVFFEFIADYAYPVDEAISGGLLSMMEAVGALVIYQVVARFLKGGSMNYAFAGGCAACLVLSTFLDEQHNRPDGEDDCVNDEDDGDDDDAAEVRRGSKRPMSPVRISIVTAQGGRRAVGGDIAEEELQEVSAVSVATQTPEEARQRRALLIAKKKRQILIARKQAAAALATRGGGGGGDNNRSLSASDASRAVSLREEDGGGQGCGADEPDANELSTVSDGEALAALASEGALDGASSSDYVKYEEGSGKVGKKKKSKKPTDELRIGLKEHVIDEDE